MFISLNVSKENIEKGVRQDSGKCPVALALRDLYPWALDISVEEYEIILVDASGESFKTVPPPACQLFINNFDDSIKVSPSTLFLSLHKC